jgi:hypothetical protein
MSEQYGAFSGTLRNLLMTPIQRLIGRRVFVRGANGWYLYSLGGMTATDGDVDKKVYRLTGIDELLFDSTPVQFWNDAAPPSFWPRPLFDRPEPAILGVQATPPEQEAQPEPMWPRRLTYNEFWFEAEQYQPGAYTVFLDAADGKPKDRVTQCFRLLSDGLHVQTESGFELGADELQDVTFEVWPAETAPLYSYFDQSNALRRLAERAVPGTPLADFLSVSLLEWFGGRASEGINVDIFGLLAACENAESVHANENKAIYKELATARKKRDEMHDALQTVSRINRNQTDEINHLRDTVRLREAELASRTNELIDVKVRAFDMLAAQARQVIYPHTGISPVPRRKPESDE